MSNSALHRSASLPSDPTVHTIIYISLHPLHTMVALLSSYTFEFIESKTQWFINNSLQIILTAEINKPVMWTIIALFEQF